MANETIATEQFICPRSNEGPSVNGGKAEWRPNDGCCSYCGSMSEANFFAAIENGAELGPTDKSYKVYVGGRGKFYFQHLSDEGKQRFIDLWNKNGLKISAPGHFYVTPFFIRLGNPLP